MFHWDEFSSWCTDHKVQISLVVGGTGLTIIPLAYLFRYRQSIRRRLKEIQDDFSRDIMVRETTTTTTTTNNNNNNNNAVVGTSSKLRRKIRCLELNPPFVNAHKDQWKLMSLGEYLSSLRPCVPGSNNGNEKDSPSDSKNLPIKFIERELEITVGSVLLKALGQRFGAAILPLLGITDVKSRTASIATSIASWWGSHFLVTEKLEELNDNAFDAGTFAFSLNEIFGFVNVREKFVKSTMEIKSIDLLKCGEVGYEPSFGQPLREQKAERTDNEVEKMNHDTLDPPMILEDLIPNPFIISKHWNSAIEGMEQVLKSNSTVTSPVVPDAEKTETKGANYDPGDRSFPEPTPINPRLLPDLYLGWGDAECTHTKREIPRNRLLAVLLNKLSHNFYKKEQKQSDFFEVKMEESSTSIQYPHNFLQALIDAGHTVEVCPRASITSFGLALCVKEQDGSWSNVPLGIFFHSGYERKGDNHPAVLCMPHGGMDLRLKGPLVGKDEDGQDNKCDIQFYVAIEGMCGWHSNHNASVPWKQTTSFSDIYTKKQSILAVKLAGILAVTFNALGTEMDLPNGGYGLLGVCNDTAALLDFAVRGETNVFPLVSTGRFLIRSSRRLIQLYRNIKQLEGDDKEDTQDVGGDDIRKLIVACCKVPSDLQASPSNLISSSKRFLASQPELLCFQLEEESRQIMTDLKDVFGQFDQSLFKFLS